ncbi:hypothetical protein N7537_001188 [Penicillium hordei]|uniref:Uncharacterized protein n=1 Tax=Penicillium hordei TaxID=40994 RepID=A0AAD6EG73_9EURO|nr:uncharacterized protein N7537_001188 [Penicillium hordei]KAJ5616074.1 hypothetical protein N7537_001188 [Penicillium hordei]
MDNNNHGQNITLMISNARDLSMTVPGTAKINQENFTLFYRLYHHRNNEVHWIGCFTRPLSYSAALPVLGNAEGTVSGIKGAVGDVTGSAANVAAPITSPAGGLTGAIKRDDTTVLGETIESIPSLANSTVTIAGSAVGTGENLVSGAAGTAEGAVSGSATKRQLNNDLIGSTLGSAVPAIIQEAKAGGLAGAIKRDETATLGETVETIPTLAKSAVPIAGRAISTAENAPGHP